MSEMIPKRSLIIGAVLAVLVVATLVIRGLPLLLLGDGDVMNLVAMDDPIYNLRLVEWMINSGHWYSLFPTFDAMTFYPYGQVMPWGPVFTWVTMLFPLAAGAASQQEIVYAALWVPPVLAAVMVPLAYLLGKSVWNWKTGLAAAVFMAFIGGQFFSRSLAGYLDHHVAEVVFGTAFALLYMYAIRCSRNVDRIENFGYEHQMLAIYAGAAYVIGFLNMPTMVMFAVVALITTTVLFIWEFSAGKVAWWLVGLNGIVFGIAAGMSYFFAYVPAEYGLTGYTVFHTAVYLGIIGWTAVLAVLAHYNTKIGNVVGYVASLGVLVAGSLIIMALAMPGQFMPFMNGIMSFFGFNQVMTTIQEARPWTFSEAWAVYNFGFVLMIGGFLVLMLRTWKDRVAENVFVLVWSAFIIVATFRQVRYEYYLAVNVALLAGVCVVYFLQRAWPAFLKARSRAPKDATWDSEGEEKENKKKSGKRRGRKVPTSTSRRALMAIPIAAVVLMFAIAFVGTSAVSEISAGAAGVYRMNPDWRGALVWMDRNTPDTGVDPYGVYEKETFTYPEKAYSVMSWWDYGHMITYFANRIPVANPFQAGVAGKYGAASFFMTDDEDELDRIADHTGIRYVITDIEMATGKFWAMATWYNATEGVSPYQQVLLVAAPASGPDQYTTSLTYNDAYYLTTIARLHIYDGSMTPAGQAFYVEIVTSPEAPYPVVTKAEQMNRTDADAAAARYNANAAPDRRATVVSPAPFLPTLDVPALHHFRLVHESGNQYVKVFEYVPGARVPGEGTIEHVVTTNTGRQFVWRASSVDGTFVVPYAGEYTVAGTGRVVVVPEEAVLAGGMVQ